MYDEIGSRSVTKAGRSKAAVAAAPRFILLRTTQVPKDEGILKRIPDRFNCRTLESAIDFALGSDLGRTRKEEQIARDICGMLRRGEYELCVNGERAQLSDPLGGVLIEGRITTKRRGRVRYLMADVTVAHPLEG